MAGHDEIGRPGDSCPDQAGKAWSEGDDDHDRSAAVVAAIADWGPAEDWSDWEEPNA